MDVPPFHIKTTFPINDRINHFLKFCPYFFIHLWSYLVNPSPHHSTQLHSPTHWDLRALNDDQSHALVFQDLVWLLFVDIFSASLSKSSVIITSWKTENTFQQMWLGERTLDFVIRRSELPIGSVLFLTVAQDKSLNFPEPHFSYLKCCWEGQSGHWRNSLVLSAKPPCPTVFSVSLISTPFSCSWPNPGNLLNNFLSPTSTSNQSQSSFDCTS